MCQVKYKVVDTPANASAATKESFLDAQGRKGWQLAYRESMVFKTEPPVFSYRWYFIRCD